MIHTLEEHYTDSQGEKRSYVVKTSTTPFNLTQLHQWFAEKGIPLAPHSIQNLLAGAELVPGNSHSTYRVGTDQ